MSVCLAMKEERATVQPFLKWAGGKRWLVNQGIPHPTELSRIVEPFVGSAAVFFSVMPEKGLLADINEELINLYCVVRDQAADLQMLMEKHHLAHSHDYYYSERGRTPSCDVERAARILYLNRTCWNGLYRVNQRGEFNVPIGTKSSVVWQGEDFSRYAELLKNATILCQDFERTIDGCGQGDYLFVDPPYTVKHNMNGFVKYNEKIFSWDDQIRLADALKRAGARGAEIVVTNADHDSVKDLYRDGFGYRSLARQSVLAGSSAHRGKTSEALFTMNLD
jgi:DNA adenine methylase